MNKTELVAAIAEKAELSKKDSEKALKAFVDVVTAELKKEEKIQLVGFGTFEVSKRAAREGRNPQTGKTCLLYTSVGRFNFVFGTFKVQIFVSVNAVIDVIIIGCF